MPPDGTFPGHAHRGLFLRIIVFFMPHVPPSSRPYCPGRAFCGRKARPCDPPRPPAQHARTPRLKNIVTMAIRNMPAHWDVPGLSRAVPRSGWACTVILQRAFLRIIVFSSYLFSKDYLFSKEICLFVFLVISLHAQKYKGQKARSSAGRFRPL